VNIFNCASVPAVSQNVGQAAFGIESLRESQTLNAHQTQEEDENAFFQCKLIELAVGSALSIASIGFHLKASSVRLRVLVWRALTLCRCGPTTTVD